MAKFAGRWSDGVPLMAAPTFEEWQAVRRRRETAERAGDKATSPRWTARWWTSPSAPIRRARHALFPSHLRRANTRDMLDPLFGATDPKRWGAPSSTTAGASCVAACLTGGPQGEDDSGEHGIVMLACCASLFRQFEFVQQQWMQYGLDFGSGNDTCPIIGNHGKEAKFVIATDPASGKPPFICDSLPQFVETRGGDYFFVPSMTALRRIASGTVDPT